MLRADNRAYDYSIYEEQELQQIPEPSAKPLKRAKKKAKPKTHLSSILFVFAMSVFIISRYAYMAEINFNISKLEKEYTKVLKENTDLNVELAKTINLETLERIAIEELGMQYPDVQNQIAYVNVSMPVEKTEDKKDDYYNINDLQENKYIAYTKAVIDNILNVLD